MATKITLKIIESTLSCKTKGHLKLVGESGTQSDYETMTTAGRASSREQAVAGFVARFGEGDAGRGTTVYREVALPPLHEETLGHYLVLLGLYHPAQRARRQLPPCVCESSRRRGLQDSASGAGLGLGTVEDQTQQQDAGHIRQREASYGRLIDSPGIRELRLWAEGADVDAAFEDIAALAAGCPFADCSHTHEPRCAVRQAIAW